MNKEDRKFLEDLGVVKKRVDTPMRIAAMQKAHDLAVKEWQIEHSGEQPATAEDVKSISDKRDKIYQDLILS